MNVHARLSRRGGAALAAVAVSITALLTLGGTATAAIVATVPLGTSAQYAVLGGSDVTNTGASILNGSLGVSPGTSITGFPPGIVVPPGTTHQTDTAAAQAQSALTAGYIDAANRPITATTTADLANLNLQAGVYAGPSHGALSLTGPLVLDGAGDSTSVFIFQTNSSLITASSSTVTLINGAQECNVFWQVGSDATLGTGSVFRGNLLALNAITVTTGVTVHGRALARNAGVTLDTDTFVAPSCAVTAPTTTTSPPATTAAAGTPITAGSGFTPRTVPPTGTGTGLTSVGTPGVPGVVGPPKTDATPLAQGDSPGRILIVVGLFGATGAAGLVANRRRMQARDRA
ncbi:MAG: hypothetical protein JWL73_2826 [Actinomycetia bacterium]|nr:hypothetical protein [Actinomycetes bacterium]